MHASVRRKILVCGRVDCADLSIQKGVCNTFCFQLLFVSWVHTSYANLNFGLVEFEEVREVSIVA